MKIAVEGCAHGELDNIYSSIKFLEDREGFKIDLLICCGDFQATRNEDDLRCMAVPPKYCKMCSFYKYYNGDKFAPILTIFIGGNHEASNYLQELPYGGWVAHNIYYLGYAGVINIAGLRIGGLSGIYKRKDYIKGHFECPPYSDDSKRSVYHIRNLEVFRLKQLSEPLHIFLSHDWPSGIWEYGNKRQLLKFKPFFEEDMDNGNLGSKPTEELLNALKPDYWFAAHLHCKFAAVVPHSCGKKTKFLALDKCLPQKRFLQIFDIPHDPSLEIKINYDLEWLTILRLTNHLLSVKNSSNYLPGSGSQERWCFKPTNEEKDTTYEMFGELHVPNNFAMTAKPYTGHKKQAQLPLAVSNPQTVLFCAKLAVDDPLELLLNLSGSADNTFDATAETTSDGMKSFIEDSDTSLTHTPQPKNPLNLPKPVNEDETFEEETIFENQLERDSGGSVERVEEEIAATKDVERSSGKTFKRRNAALYQDES